MAYDDQEVIIIVAQEGAVKDWAAYSLSNWMKHNPIDNYNHWILTASLEEFIKVVSERGNKLKQSDAELIFPNWKSRLKWRD